MSNPASYQQIEEDKKLRQSLQVVPLQGHPNRFKLFCEYPVHEDVDLAYVCSAKKSNRNMAVAASESLRRKLLRDNKLDAFQSKVIEGINKKQYVVISDTVAKELEGLPQSFQLINYVIKDTSATTKIRVVSNSSVARAGGSYNEL